jgi:hypothetical protein
MEAAWEATLHDTLQPSRTNTMTNTKFRNYVPSSSFDSVTVDAPDGTALAFALCVCMRVSRMCARDREGEGGGGTGRCGAPAAGRERCGRPRASFSAQESHRAPLRLHRPQMPAEPPLPRPASRRRGSRVVLSTPASPMPCTTPPLSMLLRKSALHVALL